MLMLLHISLGPEEVGWSWGLMYVLYNLQEVYAVKLSEWEPMNRNFGTKIET